MTHTPRSTLVIMLVLAATLIGSRPSQAAPERRGVLTFRGSVLDSSGRPIREAWVVSLGSRRGGTQVDPTGRFTLPIRCDQLEELARQPFSLRIQARRKGWVINLPGGSSELGIEIAIGSDRAGVPRLEVRSNDPAVAAAVAGAAVLDAGGNLDFELHFVGAPGSQTEYGDPVPLTVVEEVALAGFAVPESATPRDLLSGAIVAKSTGRDLAAPAQPGGHPVDRDDVVSSDGSEGSDTGPDVTKAGDDESDTLLADLDPVSFVTGPALAAESAPPAAGEMQRPRSRPRITILPVERAPGPVPSIAPPMSTTPRAASAPPVQATPRAASTPPVQTTPRAASAPPVQTTPRAASAPPVWSAPSGSFPIDFVPDSEPLIPSTESRISETPSTTVHRAPNSAAPPALGNAANSSPSVIEAPKDSSSTAARPETLALVMSAERPPSPAASGATSASATMKAERKSRRGSITATVVSAPAPSPVPSTAWPSAPRSPETTFTAVGECHSRIQGTVEVESERPLQGRTYVTVFLESDPLITDTVELFMGSPRGFELRNVPCGPQRLKFEIRSKHRFELISAEPRLDCTAGGLRQTRIVLQPIPGRRLVP